VFEVSLSRVVSARERNFRKKNYGSDRERGKNRKLPLGERETPPPPPPKKTIKDKLTMDEFHLLEVCMCCLVFWEEEDKPPRRTNQTLLDNARVKVVDGGEMKRDD
jgi:hypothetical protein